MDLSHARAPCPDSADTPRHNIFIFIEDHAIVDQQGCLVERKDKCEEHSNEAWKKSSTALFRSKDLQVMSLTRSQLRYGAA